MNEEQKRASRTNPAERRRRGPDPRLFAIVGVLIAIGLAVLLAYVMVSLNHADQCLAMRGHGC